MILSVKNAQNILTNIYKLTVQVILKNVCVCVKKYFVYGDPLQNRQLNH